MGLMKKIIEQRSGRGGFVFTNEDPQLGLQRTGVFSGASGQHMLRHKMVIPKFNAAVRQWGRTTAAQLKRSAAGASQKGKTSPRTYASGLHKGKTERMLKESIKANYRKERGGEQIETIGFGLERHGVFLQKGVGRGYAMRGTSPQRIAKSEPIAFRDRKNWFNSVLDQRISSLQAILTQHAGDAIVLNTKRMFIQ